MPPPDSPPERLADVFLSVPQLTSTALQIEALGQSIGQVTLAIERCHSTFKRFSQEWTGAAMVAYLARHARPPGSTRTKRLRKKRAARVSHWLSREVSRTGVAQ